MNFKWKSLKRTNTHPNALLPILANIMPCQISHDKDDLEGFNLIHRKVEEKVVMQVKHIKAANIKSM